MLNLRFQRISLLSNVEKAAASEDFDYSQTVVVGSNDTGKSHLIKSIYAAFGADAAVVSEKWQKADVTILLDFTVDRKAYSALRLGDQVALFDEGGKLLWVEHALVEGIGPKLAELLGFAIELPSLDDVMMVPPPQHCFLPFYQDQDRGWTDAWASFANMGLIRDFKRSILEYQTGIRPKEFYVAKAARAEAQRQQSELRAERKALDRTGGRLRAARTSVSLTFTPELFAEQIERLLIELGELRAIYDDIKLRIADLQSRRAVLVEEIEIAGSTLKELEADDAYVRDLSATQVICPTCNAVHENDFANRFGLASDADACRTFLAQARSSLLQVEGEVERELNSLSSYDERIARINNLLEHRRGETTLRDMLKDESERILDETISNERWSLDEAIGRWAAREHEAALEMADHSSDKRKAEIVKFYSDKLRDFSVKLAVKVPDAAYKNIVVPVRGTGSYGPRAFLAYHCAVLHTIAEFSSSCLCPVILDTPLRQDPDVNNARRIIDFALNNYPADMQLILGTASLHGVPYEGLSISPTHKEAFLRPENYRTLAASFRPYVNQVVGQGELDLL